MKTSTTPCEACLWCAETFSSIESLVAHLFLNHRKEEVLLGTAKEEFKVYRHTKRDRVRCFCGSRFTCADAARDVAPHFKQWAGTAQIELDSYAAHLRRESGLVRHLEKVRAQIMLDKVAKSAGEVEPAPRATSETLSLTRFLQQTLPQIQLDKIGAPEVE